jgi:hypothetical protein
MQRMRSSPGRSPGATAGRSWRTAALAAAGTAGAVLAAEVGARLCFPAARLAELRHIEKRILAAGRAVGFSPDPELGHVPVLDSPEVDAFGCRRNGCGLAKPPDKTRLLFLGDSVTARGVIVEGLRALLGSTEFEYWNAGVEGWNPVQEVQFFVRQQRPLAPDHVVLTLHNNDFFFTSLALPANWGCVLIANPDAPAVIHAPAFRWSYLYRMFVAGRHQDLAAEGNYCALVPRVEDSLRRLAAVLAADGIALTVLVLPVLRDEAAWLPHEEESRVHALAMLARLGIAHVDLREPCQRLRQRGVAVSEPADDPWHPNAAAGRAMAAFALGHGLLRRPGRRLSADVFSVSVVEGGIQELRVEAGRELAGRAYTILGTRSGSEPGVALPGKHLPLNPDDYTSLSLTGPETLLRRGRGLLDAEGRATVTVHVPAGRFASAAGTILHHACVVFGAGPGEIARVTSAVPLLLSPE